ncbi:eCIS core domain-containing protein [Flavobacterium polysaccharolyticum]|uniref:DUF4157 domain-containing protein n=1 Tax=Flavobacterium polysaccharolyticum TaxID=3133148 RepID=A0ABU9NQP4_9FLAO
MESIIKKTNSPTNHLNENAIQNKGIALQDNRPSTIIQKKANNTGLPDNLKSGIENLSGHSMDDVKVHYNSDKPAQLNAHAYAQGSQIHIASGQEKHLPHEAWHVVQQKQGRVKPTMQMKGKVNVNDDKGLEKEADIMGEKALQESYSKNITQKTNAQGQNSLIKTFSVNNVIQGKIGPDGDGKLVLDSNLKVYRAKKNTDGTYDMYDQNSNQFKQYGISPDDERYNIYDSEKMDDSEDSEKFSSSDDESSDFDDNQNEIKAKYNPESNESKKLRRVLKQGIFNAIGEGINPRYIRSDKNKLIQLIGDKFGSEENKLGLLPDLFKGINLEILEGVIKEIEEELSDNKDVEIEEEFSDNMDEEIENIDQYITTQREISGAIKKQFKSTYENIELIHDGNYPPLIIHFPLLRKFIIDNQERESFKGKNIRSDQAKGMTKLLSARLISLYNQKSGGTLPRLVEKSSFGFKTPTLADLGDNLSIRLSPGINKNITKIIVEALGVIDKELHDLMDDKTKFEFKDKVKETDDLYKYWDGGKENTIKASELLESYNEKKTLLKHLVFTQVEKGAKGMSIVGRVLERNHDNIMFFGEQEDTTLSQMAKDIFDQNTTEELEKNITNGILSSPNLDKNYDKKMEEKDELGDDLQKERLAIFSHILKTLKDKKNKIDFDDDPVSESEYEDEDEIKKIKINTGKVVVPSGMAALSVLLTKDDGGLNEKRKELKKKQTELKKKQTELKKKQTELKKKQTELKKKQTELKKKQKNKKANSQTSSDDEELELIDNQIKELEIRIKNLTTEITKKKSAVKGMIPKDSSVYYEDHDLLKMMYDSEISDYDYAPKDIIILDLNPNITQPTEKEISFKSELSKLTNSGKKVWVVDLTSSTSEEQENVYLKWKNCEDSTLLVTRVSGIKQQEGGQNMNPHGLIHWAHKADKKNGHEIIKGFFQGLQEKFPRSTISNQIRRYFKENLNSYSWKRILNKKDEQNISGIKRKHNNGSDDSSSDSENEPKKKVKKTKKISHVKEKNKEGQKESPDLWYYDDINDLAINPDSFPLFKEAYLEDVASSNAYLTEGEGHTLASQLGICLAVLEGEVDPEGYHIIKNSGSGDCLIHTLDTAWSILQKQIESTVKNHNSKRTIELRTVIAQHIDDTALETLIAAAVFGDEPGLGPKMSQLVEKAQRTQKDFPSKKTEAKKSIVSSSSVDGMEQVVQLPKLGNGEPHPTIYANHVGVHWQLVIKKNLE